jgi:hypothetical protein
MTEYTPTEAQYKGGADQKFITYELEQKTRGGGTAKIPKVKRVYVAGEVEDFSVGTFEKKSGKEVYGAKIEMKRSREGYTAERSDTGTEYEVPETEQEITKIVELPEEAQNVSFYESKDDLPERYESALQVLVAGRLLERAGLALTLAMLPVALLFGAGGAAMLAGVVPLVAARGTTARLENSLFRSSYEQRWAC